MTPRTTADTDRQAAGDDAILAVDDLVRTFGGLVAVDHVSFEVKEGSITGLIGPNGSGKTTLFNLVTGLLESDQGDVHFDGESITDYSPHEIARAGLGRTFQIPKIFTGMSVRENLAYSVKNQAGETVVDVFFRPGTVDAAQADIDDRVAETLEFLDIDHLADEYASGLSGGQRALLQLGQALMLDPDLILLDEPMAGVNPALADRLLDRLHELNDRGTTLLVVEHDIDVIMENCDHVIVMHNGAVLSQGTPDVVQADEQVVEAYLGG